MPIDVSWLKETHVTQTHKKLVRELEQEIIFLKLCISFIKILFDRERDHKWAERQAEREEGAGSPRSREPHAGLHPRTLRS